MATIGTRDDQHQRFWDVAEPFIAQGRLVEGTMMGHQCLRSASNDGFVATVERSTGKLVVKLPEERVAELIAADDGDAFAPAKKVFKEWVAVRAFDDRVWTGLIEESIRFVEGR
jgi:glucose dehydrogenase